MSDSRPTEILLVDDDRDDNYVHRRIIARSGLPVRVTEHGTVDDAMAYLKSTQVAPETMLPDTMLPDTMLPETRLPDIILLDVNMPRKSGWDFLREYDALGDATTKHTSVFILTSSDHGVDRGLADGFPAVRGYLLKPLTKDMLEHAISVHAQR